MNETTKLKALIGDDDPLLRRTCRDKRQYFTRGAAKEAIKQNKGRGMVGARHVYRCEFCELFHLSHRSNDDKWNGKIDQSKEAKLRVHRAKKSATKSG